MSLLPNPANWLSQVRLAMIRPLMIDFARQTLKKVKKREASWVF